MTDGLVATNLDEAEALGKTLAKRAGVADDGRGGGLSQCDMVFGPLALLLPSVSIETADWRKGCHDVLTGLSLAVGVAVTRTDRADR